MHEDQKINKVDQKSDTFHCFHEMSNSNNRMDLDYRMTQGSLAGINLHLVLENPGFSASAMFTNTLDNPNFLDTAL